MVRIKKALMLFLVFLVSYNNPAYSKGKSIKYLPSSQDVETVEKDYSSGSIALKEINCPTCTALSNSAKECNDCVDLKAGCPDDCLTATSPKEVRCSSEDNTDGIGNYKCTSAPFNFDDCSQIECGLRSGDNPETTNCSNLKCSGGSVQSGSSPYGRQRRGCPDADSDELVPSGCSSCSVSGSGKDRVWTCTATTTCTASSSPSFVEPCSGYGRCDGYSSYYDVKYVWEDNAKNCSHSCSSCNASECEPASPAAECNTDGRSSCDPKYCSKTETCYYGNSCAPCTNVCTSCCPPYPPPPKGYKGKWPPCSPSFTTVCSPCLCNDSISCEKKASVKSYIFSLNSNFKSCIDTCTTYADDYERCQDRVECCQEAIGYFDNCTATDSDGNSICEKRSTVSPACYNATTGDCVRLNDAAEQCLEGAVDICFKEIGRYDIKDVIDIDSVIRYDFTARTGEAYNVIWQINTEPLNEAKKDDNTKFYTMIKVWDPASNKIVYRSMLHQKSLNAAFSIYGKALIPKDTLDPGKNYQVQVHYFMNDNSGTDYKVEVKHMGLTVIRVRE